MIASASVLPSPSRRNQKPTPDHGHGCVGGEPFMIALANLSAVSATTSLRSASVGLPRRQQNESASVQVLPSRRNRNRRLITVSVTDFRGESRP
jgi:hypothetical protein